MKEKTCCFSGHRKFDNVDTILLIKSLNYEIEKLLKKGVKVFLSGGALGFDQIAASIIADKKKLISDIKLVFVLPCKNQDQFWNSEQRYFYNDLLAKADEIIFISDNYTEHCMKKRNLYMVNKSAFCICALLNPYSGTGQTVRLAKKAGLHIINVLDRQ